MKRFFVILAIIIILIAVTIGIGFFVGDITEDYLINDDWIGI